MARPAAAAAAAIALAACGRSQPVRLEDPRPADAAPGCADGTREGLSDAARYPDIAACGGRFEGAIFGPSARSLCAAGWRACRGDDAPVGGLPLAEARAFGGCFAFDAAHDCFACYPTCEGALGSCRRCCVTLNPTDPDMAGMGAGCTGYDGGEPGTSCLASGRLDATTNDFGCRFREGLSGVVCCRG